MVKTKVKEQEVRLLVDSGAAGLLVYRKRLKVRLERLPADRGHQVATPEGMMRAA